MAMNKKAMYFTITSILMLGLIFFFLSLNQELALRAELDLKEHRIMRVNDYLDDLENSYLEKILSNLGYLATQQAGYSTAPNKNIFIQNYISTNMGGKLTTLQTITNNQIRDIQVNIGSTSAITANAIASTLSMKISYTVSSDDVSGSATELAGWQRNNVLIETYF